MNCGPVRNRRRGSARQGEAEFRSFPRFRLYPNTSVMPLDDALANGQTHSCAGQLASVQPLENAEDPIGILRVDPNPVVFNADCPLVSSLGRPNRHVRWLTGPIFDGISNQVLEDLR